MTDLYSGETTMLPDQEDPEEQAQLWYQRFAIAMAISFFFPLYISMFGTSKLIFPNIEMIGKMGHFVTLMALYPLLAAIIIMVAITKTTDLTRSIILLSTGLFPFLLVILFQGDLFAGSMNQIFKTDNLLLFIPLSLLGVHIGAKVTEIHGLRAGQIIAGISGIVFLALILLPIDRSGMPLYFGLFKLLKSGGHIALPGAVVVFVVALIGIFSVYSYASFMAIINMRDTDKSTELAMRIRKLVFLASMALPISIFFVTMFTSGISGMKMYLFTVYVKYFPEIGAIIGLISLSCFDLISFSIPKTVKGGDLFKTPAKL